MVFQDYALYPHMTVRQNMAFALENLKHPRQEIEQRVQQAAELLQIGELLDRRPRELSGGQRQRVAVGRGAELYEQPANTFVAAFLGSPPMNLLPARLAAEDDHLVVAVDTLRLPLSAALSRRSLIFINSVLGSVTATAGVVVVAALAGYVFAKMEFPGKRPLFWLVLLTLMLPGQAMLAPMYALMIRLGWLDTFFRSGEHRALGMGRCTRWSGLATRHHHDEQWSGPVHRSRHG